MPRSNSRPHSPRPRRDRRPGRAGIGPGPAYRPSSSGGGTSHRSSQPTRMVANMAVGLFLVFPALVVAGVVTMVLHVNGVF